LILHRVNLPYSPLRKEWHLFIIHLFLYSLHAFGRSLHGNIDSLTFLATFFLFDAMKIL